MDTECDVSTENMESKLVPSPPSTQSEISTDGDGSISQVNLLAKHKMPVGDISDDISPEPKAKKRRKQMKPLKCESAVSDAEHIPIDEPREFLKPSEEGELESGELLKDETFETKRKSLHDDTVNKNQELNGSPDILSQKNILSHVSDMLYNNQIATQNVTNQGSGHHKGLSQLLSEKGIHESNDSRNMDKSILQSFYPQMPPLLPLNPSDIVGELSKLTSVFSQLADLPTQLTQANLGMTQSNRSFVTSNGVRIFNPEAYCELCEKEFCNKYFLKTHKANKHGVCSIDNGMSPYRNLHKISSLSSHIPPTQVPSQTSEPNTPSTGDAYCNICQKSFCNKYFLKKHRQNIHGIIENGTEHSGSVPSSIHVPVISSLPVSRMASSDLKDLKAEPGVSLSLNDAQYLNMSLKNIKNTFNGSVTANMQNFNGVHSPFPTSTKNGSTKTAKDTKDGRSDKYLCEMCGIEFCDKHYLDVHRQSKHGCELPKLNQDFASFSEIGKVENTEKLDKALDQSKCSEISELNTEKCHTCFLCMRIFPTLEAIQNHMIDFHKAVVKQEDCIENSNESTSAEESTKRNTDSPKPKSLKQPSICNSENSNNSNDAVTTVYCSLCLLKFKDKSSLMRHFDTSHHLKETAIDSNGMCGAKVSLGLSGSLYGIDVKGESTERIDSKYLLMNHRDSPKQDSIGHLGSSGVSVQGQSDDSKDSSVSANSIFSCEICGQVFPSKLLLQVHLVSKHVNNSETQTTNLNDLIALSVANQERNMNFSNFKQNEISKDKSQNEIVCSCCSYIKSDGSIASGKLIPHGNKTIQCHICAITYHYSEYYQHHLTHRDAIASEIKSQQKTISQSFPNSNKDPSLTDTGTKSKSKTRKLRRFRCSKCDTPFRTRNKCLHHIQVVHKSKRTLGNHVLSGSSYNSSQKKSALTTITSKANEQVALLSDIPNSLPPNIYTKVAEKINGVPTPEFQHAVPYMLPKNSKDIIMQAFHLSEPKVDGHSTLNVFVPSLVYLPVSHKLSEPVTVTFTLTPA